jgi:hypothetical protein
MKKSAAAKGKIHGTTEPITKQTEEQPRTKSAAAQNKIRRRTKGFPLP